MFNNIKFSCGVERILSRIANIVILHAADYTTAIKHIKIIIL